MQAQQSLGPRPDGRLVVELNDIRKGFGGVVAVDGVSLKIGKGEIVSLLGPSGCGKTTTLRIIAGLDDVDSGEVLIDGKTVASREKKVFAPPEKRNVGLVFQGFALWPHMTVYNNIAYCLKARKFDKEMREQKIKQYLKLVNLVGYEQRYPSQLSGGEQQRVALARALAYEPKVLLMDEPLSNIDMKDRERVRKELRTLLKGLGTSVLHVTHDQSESFALADKVIVMSKGRIMQEGNPDEIYERPKNLFVCQFIGRSNVFKAKVKKVENGKAIFTLEGTNVDLQCKTDKELAPGSERYASFRPNMIELSQTRPAQQHNVLEGEATEVEYLGVSYEFKFVSQGLSFTVSVDKSKIAANPVGVGKSYLIVPEESIYILQE